MPFQPPTENEAYAGMLCEHVERMVARLAEIPDDAAVRGYEATAMLGLAVIGVNARIVPK